MAKKKPKPRKKLSDEAAKKKINADLKHIKTLRELAKKYPAIAKELEKKEKKRRGQYTVKYTVEHSF